MKLNHALKTILTGLSILILVSFYGCKPKTGSSTAQVPTAINEAYRHPLDPLDSNEIKSVKKILLDAGKIDTTYMFYLVNLQEPPKTEILAYQAGQPFRREAFASVYNYATNITSETVVDLKTGKVVYFKDIPGVQPGAFLKDSIVYELLKKDSVWIKALAKRGIPVDSTSAFPLPVGELGIGPKDHREFVIQPHYKNKKSSHLGIDGLFAYVDLTDKKILKIMDDGGKGFSQKVDIGYLNEDSVRVVLAASKPLHVSQPEGTTFKVEGNKIVGKTWNLRVGIHNREGLVIYDARFKDNGKERAVLYRGSMAEMFVPYGSTDLGLAAWNYFDGGTYRMGQGWPKEMKPLSVGRDVPENSVLFPATFHNDRGVPKRLDSVVAVYEEYGGPLTRHGKFSVESRNLVVKYFTKIGNYDYAFKWIFREDGQIKVDTELTGIIGIKGVNRQVDLPGAPDPTFEGGYYGTLVAPNVEGVNHQHFFSFRLDMDVDGPINNNVEEMNTKAVPAGPGNPYSNAFVMQMTRFQNEEQAKRSQNAESNRHWMVSNSQVSNVLGHHSGYMLMPGHNSKPYAAPGSPARKMGDLYEHHLWVTAYNETEQHPAGDYPVSRGIVDGLPAWTANNENLENKDVVLWFNSGITHIVRPEDWPVMNVHTMSFTLMPFGFFDQNPIVKMPNAPKPKQMTASLSQALLCAPPKENVASANKKDVKKPAVRKVASESSALAKVRD